MAQEKIMSKRFVSAAVVAVFLGGSFTPCVAAAADSPPPMIALDELADRLGLTPEQQAKIEPALEERNRRLRELRVASEAADGQRRKRLAAAREARKAQQAFVEKVTPVLSREQQAKWQELREEMRERLKAQRR
jgi:hypothetical protein